MFPDPRLCRLSFEYPGSAGAGPRQLIIFFVAENAETVYSQQKTNKKRPKADCGIERGETTRPARYDLNQIPYEYTVEVTNRFKGLDLVNRVPEELWSEVCNIVQEAGTKTIPKKKKCKKAK